MESQRHEDAKLTVVDSDVERLAKEVVDAAFYVHRYFGPGMLESIYEMAMYKKLKNKGLFPVRQVNVPVCFEDELLDACFRADLIINDSILLEIKACERLLPVHRAQALSYARLSNMPLAFLINFNVPVVKNGIVRIINDRFAS